MDEAEMNKFMLEAGLMKLDLLYDYTKFHIGAYLTLTAAYISVATARNRDKVQIFPLNPKFMWVAIILFMLAGLSGGIIVSSITQTDAINVAEFLAEPLGPVNQKWLSGLHWTYIEHNAFWIGLVAAVLSFAKRGNKAPEKVA